MASRDPLKEAVADVGETMRSTADQAMKAGSDMADLARQAATNAARAIASQASELGSNIAEEVGHAAEDQKARGADAIRELAGALKSAAGAFDSPSPAIAGYVRDAAGQIDGLSASLKDRSVNELISAASNLARERPVAFFAGAVAAGFAVSRLLKASAAAAPEAEAGPAASTSGNPMQRSGMQAPQMHQGRQGSAFDPPGKKQW